MTHRFFVTVAATLALAGCAYFGHHRGSREDGVGRRSGPPPGAALLHYDANHDGKVTRAELEAGLRAEFAAADTDHNGCLDADEIRAVNEARWAADPTSTPLVDWTHKGCIGFDIFAAEARSLFAQLDADKNGILTPDELKGGTAGPSQQQPQGGEGSTRGRGRRGGQTGAPDGGGPGQDGD